MRRVSFDPLALLLDASLEGELELVKRTAGQVTNPSAANDEGITALHNAICAGHFEIVRFLVQFGCDVNAQDSDGWYVTPIIYIIWDTYHLCDFFFFFPHPLYCLIIG
jgi:ankyrin repeat protein